jgi:hypothetical protein
MAAAQTLWGLALMPATGILTGTLIAHVCTKNMPGVCCSRDQMITKDVPHCQLIGIQTRMADWDLSAGSCLLDSGQSTNQSQVDCMVMLSAACL